MIRSPADDYGEVMKSQGMQQNQQVVFLSDGGEDIRQVREYLHPNSEHVIDWFHIMMRLTVLQQQTKALEEKQPEDAAAVSKQLKALIKHLLWHGNGEEALERLSKLLIDLKLMGSPSQRPRSWRRAWRSSRLTSATIRNPFQTTVSGIGRGETISTAFVESTINQVVSRRFVKRQQMHGTLRGAHLLLQTRTKVLNNELEEVFRRWYPLFRAQDKAA
jgi:hypothetical protein